MLKIELNKRNHKGIVLDVSGGKFDNGAATFATLFVDKEEPNTNYLFYTGAKDTHWSHTSIGVATSRDGIDFRKADKLNPIIENQKTSFCSKEALTPTVVKVGNQYYMILAGKPASWKGRRIGIAYADDPRGPWRIIGELIRPKEPWEGNDIDLGPSITKISEHELIVYYSNVTKKRSLGRLFGRRFPIRKIGILKLKINSPSSIEAYRYESNPLEHLNGPKGSWNESLFCPGYLGIQDKHCLFPTASTYSLGFPYRQYIGMITGSSLYFEKPQQMGVLVDGPVEKKEIIPAIKSEIALDTPCPFVRKDKLYLYYAVMDRADLIWKTALTTFQIN